MWFEAAADGDEANVKAWLDAGEVVVAFASGDDEKKLFDGYGGAVTRCTIEADPQGNLVVDFFELANGPME